MTANAVIVIGGGGHAKVIVDILVMLGTEIVGIAAPNVQAIDAKLHIYPWLGDDRAIQRRYANTDIKVINGIGQVGTSSLRRRVYEEYSAAGFRFEKVVHPDAIIASDVLIGEGVQVMAGAIIQTSASIGTNTIINTRACIDHDCLVGEHVHLAPGVILSGGVSVENNTFVGAGAIVIQNVKIMSNSVIGAGAVVTKDIPQNVTYVGVPAKELRR